MKNPLRRLWALLLTLALALSLAVPAQAAPPAPRLSSLEFTGDKLENDRLTIHEGEVGRLVAAFERTDPTDVGSITFTWSIDDPTVAALERSEEILGPGYATTTSSITGLKVGYTTVTVSGGGQTASCNIYVAPSVVDVNGVSVEPTELSIGVGETYALKANVRPADATNKNVTWESSNELAATVDASGVVTGVGVGSANITVKTERNSLTAVCRVTVHGGSTLTLNRDTLSMSLNSTSTLTGTLSNYDGSRISWSSDHPEIVSVGETSNSGVPVSLEAKAVGTAVITAKPQNVADPPANLVAKCTVTVTAEPVREVRITCPNTGYMSVGGSAWRLSVSVIPSTAPQTVTWSSADTSVVTVDETGRVTAVGPGRTTVVATAAGGVKDEYAVEVSGILFPNAARVYVDRSLNLLTKTDEFAGLQRFGDAQTASPVTWTSSNASIAPVTSGGVVAGRYPGTSNITVHVGSIYEAVCVVTVEEDIAQAVTATVKAGDKLDFSSFRSTLNDRCVSKTGAGLSYITNITAPTDQGIVYYNYISPDSPNHGVGASEKYYYTAPANVRAPSLLEDLCFIPKGSFSGECTITYSGYNTNNDPYNGKIIVTVQGSGDVTYLTAKERPLAFRGDDFANMCLMKTGRSIRYVTFGQPSTTTGVLYYQYSAAGQYSQKVTSNTRYYASSNPSIDTLTFVPAKNFTGAAKIPYTCFDSSGASYSGTVTVNVYAPDGSASGGVEYTIAPNQRVTMVPADFNTVSRDKNGSTLSYILFDALPASNEGVLYYDYSSAGDPGDRVTTSTRYYRTSSNSQPRLDRVSFVPASGFTGTVSIPYTGYDTSGGRFTDTLVIHVTENSGAVTYTTTVNRPVSFNAPDFNEACQRAMSQGLDHVRFSLPSSREGVLYYNYNSSRSNNTRVSANANYYRSGTSNAIANITFVPASGFTGTCSFTYTGYASGEGTYTGTVQIKVEGGGTPASTGITYTGSSLPIALRTSDFQSACTANTGGTLDYIRFNSFPSAGRVYSSYVSPSLPGTAAVAGANYSVNSYPYISQLAFVPKAEYQGQATLSYTGYDTQGRSYTGTVVFSLSNSYCYTPFTDMSDNWAKASVEFLRQAGVVNGYSNNTVYGPYDNVTRGQFTLMICRAFGFSTDGGGSSFRDVPQDSVFAGAVAAAQSMGIVQGTGNGRFQPNSPITRQSAMTMICRALEAAGQSVPAADVSLLSSYADGGQVSAFARPAVASLIQMGAVRGNSSMRLNPTAAISRAEMAVILHRVLAR